MTVLERLRHVLEDGRTVRAIDDDIYSVLEGGPHEHRYDRLAPIYDAIIGSWPYNRALWGNTPRDYAAFVRCAVRSPADGPLLDAGCGTLVFSAAPYLEGRRPVIAFDLSLEMLRRARARLRKAGAMPGHVVLLQGNLTDLPFRRTVFPTIVCMNVLHLREDSAALVASLGARLAAGGRLHLTSLVATHRLVGDRYLDLLHRAREVARPRTVPELNDLLRGAIGPGVRCWARGNMAYAVATGPGRSRPPAAPST